MIGLPTGTVTFLFTDLEGSIKLWEEYPDKAHDALRRHDALIETCVEEQGGLLVRPRGEGDSRFAVFVRASDAVAAACTIQRAFFSEPWTDTTPLRIRIALHTGEADLREGDYYGGAVNRCARIRSLAHGGQVLLSMTTQELVHESLPKNVSLRDLGLHRLKDLQRPERIFQLIHPALPADFPPLKSLDVFPNNLPVQLTSFIGREKEMIEVKYLLSTTRLLTLVGASGCGKTRLALQVTADLLEEFEDGVWLVELAALSDPALIPHEVASTLGLGEQAKDRLMEALSNHLRRKKLLLLLDNCEHLVTASASLVNTLLRNCPNLRILAASREALNITGETTWRVPSLSLPDPQEIYGGTRVWEYGGIGKLSIHPYSQASKRSGRQVPIRSVSELSQYEAVRLFIDRAEAVLPTFKVTNQNIAAIAQICHRLDGIPLAIELVAARVKVLSIEQILSRLNDCFRLLTGGSRTALPRQQTLRALIDWSYELLSEKERTLWHRLSVFAGGFTLEAVEAICTEVPQDIVSIEHQIEEHEILELLSQLVNKSLVMVEEQNTEIRYRLLETIRQYGAEKLQASGESIMFHRHHRDWYLRLAERAELELQGPDQRLWLDRLDIEHDNLRAALEWCKTGEIGTETGLRLAGALWRFWSVRGYSEEGRKWLTGAMERSNDVSPSVRAKALDGAGILAWSQGDYVLARTLYKESLVIRKEVDDKGGIAYSLGNLGSVAYHQGDFTQAQTLFEESLILHRELGDKRGIANSLGNLGLVALNQGNYAMARTLFEESLALYRILGHKEGISYILGDLGNVAYCENNYLLARTLFGESLAIRKELGNKRGIASALGNLGNVAYQLSNYKQAFSLYEESLTIRQKLGDKMGIAYSLHDLGKVYYREGDYAPARWLYEESLTIRRKLGDKLGIIYSLEGFAGLETVQERFDQAVRLYGAAEALRETIKAPLPPPHYADYENNVNTLQARLTTKTFAEAWKEGRVMTMEQAIDYALD
jgi:predicted ATPase/class 3 adenylate cyclase/Tfp pilus assembly protein PilF